MGSEPGNCWLVDAMAAKDGQEPAKTIKGRQRPVSPFQSPGREFKSESKLRDFRIGKQLFHHPVMIFP